MGAAHIHGLEAGPLRILRLAAVAGVLVRQRQDEAHAVLRRLCDYPVQALAGGLKHEGPVRR